ncbi:imidazoleglycerol-phosphate dehydratase HisB [Hyphobacterium marinum]|uniref:Imidazoleglycerol-phosphate dehydratase n=1 Tax=Hyphobacterium marinum TaxID=3116574 RepID=A0ABU7LZZ6_9PROT|nr:imidazoleglycerol-phosphate dehydratase HisB [Hyphobacterium sp. Y6023]MEE2566740.1 imidazoleglycerol-phosphate dehydratase HisB [Hyphobacterium sp. Y6023]
MTGFLDLAAPASRQDGLEDLRLRAAASLGVPADSVVLAATPEAFALAGLDAAAADVIGPPDCPVAVLSVAAMDETPRTVEATLSSLAIKTALEALAPVAMAARQENAARQMALLKACANALESWPETGAVRVSRDRLDIVAADPDALANRLDAAGIRYGSRGQGLLSLYCDPLDRAEALADRLGVRPPRRAVRRRKTAETDITVAIDLDGDGTAQIATGIAFFDHMLEQVARHGGFALRVTASGDLDVDAHHTVEDVCLALGAALAEALGDKRGLARFGFELPMDEARAGVWIDLSGRPYAVFNGDIPGDRVGGLPVEMVPHAFRSLAEALKASIQVDVCGENAHHMTEACFKAFGRALRQAIRIEGNSLPSTKGTL